jgi:cholesterol transport system auxiliary component
MNAMNKPSFNHSGRIFAAGLCLATLGGCNALSPTTAAHPDYYALDHVQSAAPVVMPAAAPTLIINPPHATAGFSSPRIIYVREAHKLEYFANSEWVDPPARMLAPLLVAATANSGAFRAVVPTPSAAAGDLRLDTEIIRLQHEFGTLPSRVRFTLRANLVDNKTREVLAWQEFDTSVAAASEDAYGGVVAANRAVATVLENVSAFCAEAARNAWKKK